MNALQQIGINTKKLLYIYIRPHHTVHAGWQLLHMTVTWNYIYEQVACKDQEIQQQLQAPLAFLCLAIF